MARRDAKKKHLNSFSWLREVKAKKYPIYRFDTLISKNKYIDVKIIDNGGWHFSQLKTPEDIETKLLNQEHHDEYKLAKDKLPNVADLVKRKTIIYDYGAKSTDYKFSKEFKLKTISIENLPKYLKMNTTKYSEWFDV
jgi:beta-1,4-mannosyl-glycoprotein beta-1,4-N-acetylglucosaminyltransferase